MASMQMWVISFEVTKRRTEFHGFFFCIDRVCANTWMGGSLSASRVCDDIR